MYISLTKSKTDVVFLLPAPCKADELLCRVATLTYKWEGVSFCLECSRIG